MWLQYEEAKNDFDVERKLREDHAQTMIMCKDRRISELNLEIRHLHSVREQNNQRVVYLHGFLCICAMQIIVFLMI